MEGAALSAPSIRVGGNGVPPSSSVTHRFFAFLN